MALRTCFVVNLLFHTATQSFSYFTGFRDGALSERNVFLFSASWLTRSWNSFAIGGCLQNCNRWFQRSAPLEKMLYTAPPVKVDLLQRIDVHRVPGINNFLTEALVSRSVCARPVSSAQPFISKRATSLIIFVSCSSSPKAGGVPLPRVGN